MIKNPEPILRLTVKNLGPEWKLKGPWIDNSDYGEMWSAELYGRPDTKYDPIVFEIRETDSEGLKIIGWVRNNRNSTLDKLLKPLSVGPDRAKGVFKKLPTILPKIWETLTKTETTWTYERYWAEVLGEYSAENVVEIYDLGGGPQRAIDEWLGEAEVAAHDLPLPRAWDEFHQRALAELEAAAEDDRSKSASSEVKTPQDVQREIRTLLSYCSGPQPSRAMVASKLRELANKVSTSRSSVAQRFAADTGGSEDFIKRVRSQLKLYGRKVILNNKSSLGKPSSKVFINFVNLPSVTPSWSVDSGGISGAEAENNLMMFMVDDFDENPRKPPPTGKVTIKMLFSALPHEYKLQEKTGAPSQVAKYLADFINKVVKEVEPKFTHTGRTASLPDWPGAQKIYLDMYKIINQLGTENWETDIARQKRNRLPPEAPKPTKEMTDIFIILGEGDEEKVKALHKKYMP